MNKSAFCWRANWKLEGLSLSPLTLRKCTVSWKHFCAVWSEHPASLLFWFYNLWRQMACECVVLWHVTEVCWFLYTELIKPAVFLSTMVAFLMEFLCIVLCIGIVYMHVWQAGRCYVSSCITFQFISLDSVFQWTQDSQICRISWLTSLGPPESAFSALQSWCCENSGFEHFTDNCLPRPYFYFWSRISCSPEWHWPDLALLSPFTKCWHFRCVPMC